MRIVERQDGGAAGHQAVEDLGLGVGDLRHRGEELDMHRLDRGDDRDVRPHHLRQRRDLAGMVHAELEHAVAGVARHARQAERRAPLVVEVAGAGEGRREQRQHRAQALPWCWSCRRCRSRRRPRPWSGRARRGPDPPAPSWCRRLRSPARRRADCSGGDGSARRPRRAATRRRRNHGRRSSALAAPRTGRPAPGCAKSIETPATAKSPAALPGDGGGDLGGGPERAHRTSLTGAPPSSARDLARHFGIVERIGLVADDLIGLVPLAGDHQQVALAQFAHADADRLGAVADLDRARRLGQDLGADRRRHLRCADCRR